MDESSTKIFGSLAMLREVTMSYAANMTMRDTGRAPTANREHLIGIILAYMVDGKVPAPQQVKSYLQARGWFYEDTMIDQGFMLFEKLGMRFGVRSDQAHKDYFSELTAALDCVANREGRNSLEVYGEMLTSCSPEEEKEAQALFQDLMGEIKPISNAARLDTEDK